jgi:hypothetical protein
MVKAISGSAGKGFDKGQFDFGDVFEGGHPDGEEAVTEGGTHNLLSLVISDDGTRCQSSKLSLAIPHTSFRLMYRLSPNVGGFLEPGNRSSPNSSTVDVACGR